MLEIKNSLNFSPFYQSYVSDTSTRQFTDWTPVHLGEVVSHDPIKYPLRIKTTMDFASEGEIRVRFYNVNGAHIAGLNIKIATTPQYWLHYCMNKFRDFPTNTVLPPLDEKIWVISITRTSGVRIIVHCNGQEVLNLQLTNSVCSANSDWINLWNKDFDKISFPSGDAAFYFQFPPGKFVI